MSNGGFTYERETSNAKLEKMEWDNTWWEHTEDKDTTRGLYIGDSISCGIRHPLNNVAQGSIRIDGFGTSKALDNPFFKDSLSMFIAQEQRLDFAMINNGLHGWHMSTDEYAEYFEEMVKFLIDKLGGKPLYIVTSTTVADTERDALVVERNLAMRSVAEKYSLTVIDLYPVSKTLTHSDGVHFVDEDYTVLAEHIYNIIGK